MILCNRSHQQLWMGNPAVQLFQYRVERKNVTHKESHALHTKTVSVQQDISLKPKCELLELSDFH